MIKSIFLFLSACAASLSFASAPGKSYFGVSALSQNLWRTTDNTAGATEFLGPIHFPLHFQGYFTGFFGAKAFAPKLAFTVIPKESGDGATEVSYQILSLPLIFPWSAEGGDGAGAGPRADWKVGVSYVVYSQKGAGGTKVLNNGTGTATFYLPNRVSNTQFLTLDLGLSKDITPTFRFDLDLMFSGLWSESRATSLLLSLNYEFNGLFGGAASAQ